ncbi:MAG: sulfite exporter TauE/SafE family protein [Pseudomonadota bacterium]
MDVLGDSGVLSLAFAAGFLAVLCASAVQSTAGIGFGLIAAPVLLLIDPKFVPGTVIFLGILVSFLSAMRDLPHINRAFVAAGIAGRVPAAVLAASLVAILSPTAFQVIFAVLILAAVGLSVFGPAIRPSVPGVATAGVASGFMGTLTSVGAPPFAIAMQNLPAHELRATMNAVLLLGACVSLASLAAFGSFGWAEIVRGFALIPAVLLGFFAARFIIADERTAPRLRNAVLTLCVTASIALLARAVLI